MVLCGVGVVCGVAMCWGTMYRVVLGKIVICRVVIYEIYT